MTSSALSAPEATADQAAERHLARLGVHDGLLSDRERASLDADGFCVMPGLIDAPWLDRLRDAFDRLARQEGRTAEAGNDRHDVLLNDLVNKDAAFDGEWSHPRVLAAVRHVLRRPFKLSSLNGREPGLRSGRQGLHGDWRGHVGAPPYHVVNSLWVLDDMGPENGATRLLPGSHRWSEDRIAAIGDPEATHAGELVLAVPAGTVVVFNAHCRHGGTMNQSGARRRLTHGYFTAREHPAQLDQQRHVHLETWRRLSRPQRWLLGVDEE